MIAVSYARTSVTRSLRVLLAMLGLLALATSASAECAWVLWAQLGTPRGIEWFVVEGVPTYEACESKRVSSLVKGQHIGHVCLPDTVDPRAPKRDR